MIYPKYFHEYGFSDAYHSLRGLCKDYSVPLSEMIKKKIRIKHVFFLDSGRAALSLVLRQLNLPPGSEVAIPVNICSVVPEAIKKNKLTPLCVDIDNNMTLSIKSLKERISKKTKVIIPTYMFGNVPKMREIQDIAEKNDLIVIEDMAQAFNPQYGRKTAGSFGLCSFISLDVTKQVSAFGGGILMTNNDELYKKICSDIRIKEGLLKDVGRIIKLGLFVIATKKLVYTLFTKRFTNKLREKSFYVPAYRKLSNIGLALAYSQIKKIDRVNSEREKIVKKFCVRLRKLIQDRTIEVYIQNSRGKPGFLVLPIGIRKQEKRSEIVRCIESKIVDLPKPSPLLEQSHINARRIDKRLILLPTYPAIGTEIDKIVRAIEKNI